MSVPILPSLCAVKSDLHTYGRLANFSFIPDETWGAKMDSWLTISQLGNTSYCVITKVIPDETCGEKWSCG